MLWAVIFSLLYVGVAYGVTRISKRLSPQEFVACYAVGILWPAVLALMVVMTLIDGIMFVRRKCQ